MKKIASLSGQELQPTGTTKWATTLRFGKILGTTSVERSIKNPQNVVRCKIHRPAMISHKLFSYFDALEPIIREIEGPFSMMTLHDLETGVKGKI